jgi:hypothetical protein
MLQLPWIMRLVAATQAARFELQSASTQTNDTLTGELFVCVGHSQRNSPSRRSPLGPGAGGGQQNGQVLHCTSGKFAQKGGAKLEGGAKPATRALWLFSTLGLRLDDEDQDHRNARPERKTRRKYSEWIGGSILASLEIPGPVPADVDLAAGV